jgi:hypothetical protein
MLAIPLPGSADTLEAPRLWVLFEEQGREQAEWIHRELPGIREDIVAWLGVSLESTLTVHLVHDYEGLRNVVDPRLGERLVAVSDAPGVIAIRLDALEADPYLTLPEVVKHELVHHVLSELPRPPLPPWFEEGLATTWSGEGPTRVAVTPPRDLMQAGALPTFSDLLQLYLARSDERFLVYPMGFSAVSLFLERHGDDELRRLLDRVGEGRPFEEAFREAAGMGVEQFEYEWRTSLLEDAEEEVSDPPQEHDKATTAVVILVVLVLLATFLIAWSRNSLARR